MCSKNKKIRPADCEILIERDKIAMGVAGIYKNGKDTFWQLIDEGENPELVSEGTGTNSRNCPLIAVGNVPYNGNNPLKYLAAYFDCIVWVNGKEKRVIQKGDVIEPIKEMDKIKLRVICTNLGEVEWLDGRSQNPSEGNVDLVVHSGQDQKIPIKESLKRGETTEFCFDIPIKDKTTVELIMKSYQHAHFVLKYSFKFIQEK